MYYVLVSIVVTLGSNGQYTKMELFETPGMTKEACYAAQGEHTKLRNGKKTSNNVKDIEKIMWSMCKQETKA